MAAIKNIKNQKIGYKIGAYATVFIFFLSVIFSNKTMSIYSHTYFSTECNSAAAGICNSLYVFFYRATMLISIPYFTRKNTKRTREQKRPRTKPQNRTAKQAPQGIKKKKKGSNPKATHPNITPTKRGPQTAQYLLTPNKNRNIPAMGAKQLAYSN